VKDPLMPLRKLLGPTLALAIAVPAIAQPAPPPPASPPPVGAAPGASGAAPMMRDPFGDATILRKDAEAQAAARFDALDTDKDGSLSSAELAAARPQRPGGEAGGRGGQWRGEGSGRGPGRGGMGRMMDANGDGKVTKDEFVTATLRRFDRMDADHDGQLTKAERQAAFAAMRARMEERMRAAAEGQMGAQMDGSGD
jgi:hypothetical protein